jgi:hypothetical protein
MRIQYLENTEDRVRAAMQLLAETHHPDTKASGAASTWQSERSDSRSAARSRWFLAAASIAIVAGGLAAIAVVQPDDDSASTATAPEATTNGTILSTPTTTTALAPTTTVPVPNADLRFAEPLTPGTLATLDPAPSEPVAAFEVVEPTIAELRPGGIDSRSDVWMVSDDEWVGNFTVSDYAIPWQVATDGQTVTDVDGVEAVVIPILSTVALRLDTGGTRVISAADIDDLTESELIDAAVALAALIGVDPVGSDLASDRFVIPVGTIPQGPLVRYGVPVDGEGTDELVELSVLRLDRTPTDLELRWLAASLSDGNAPQPIDEVTLSAPLDGGRQTMVELITPLDVLTVVAPPTADLATLRDGLGFTSADRSGLTVEPFHPAAVTNVVAEGEHDWGRWQIGISDDGACRGVTSALWRTGELRPEVGSTSSCDVDVDAERVICSSTGTGRTLVVALGIDPEDLDVELDGRSIVQSVEPGTGAVATLLEVADDEANSIVVRIDGVVTACSPV